MAIKFAAYALVGALAAGGAYAAPVTFEFTSTVSSTDIPGTNVGDTVVYKVFADNGSASVLGQAWGTASYLGASADIGNGAYTATFDAIHSSFSAVTDALGDVASFNLSDFVGNSGSLADAPQFLLNGGGNNLFTGTFVLDTVDFTTPGNFTVSLDASTPVVPLPAGIWLLVGGLGGLAFIRRRKDAAA